MSVSSVGSSTTATSTADSELQRAQQKLAADLAAKATDRVIAADKASVTKVQREAAQQRTGTGSVDMEM
jgi:F0F1-type ATP synthase assembly protein I